MSYTSVTVTGSAASATTVSLPAAPGISRVIKSVIASCSGAASGPITLTINDAGSPEFVTDLSLTIGVPYVLNLPADGMSIGTGDATTIVASAGAASSVIKLDVAYVDA